MVKPPMPNPTVEKKEKAFIPKQDRQRFDQKLVELVWSKKTLLVDQNASRMANYNSARNAAWREVVAQLKLTFPNTRNISTEAVQAKFRYLRGLTIKKCRDEEKTKLLSATERSEIKYRQQTGNVVEKSKEKEFESPFIQMQAHYMDTPSIRGILPNCSTPIEVVKVMESDNSKSKVAKIITIDEEDDISDPSMFDKYDEDTIPEEVNSISSEDMFESVDGIAMERKCRRLKSEDVLRMQYEAAMTQKQFYENEDKRRARNDKLVCLLIDKLESVAFVQNATGAADISSHIDVLDSGFVPHAGDPNMAMSEVMSVALRDY